MCHKSDDNLCNVFFCIWQQGGCRYNSGAVYAVVSSFSQISSNPNSIMDALQYGPVSVALNAMTSFQAYKYNNKYTNVSVSLLEITGSRTWSNLAVEFTPVLAAVVLPTTLSSLLVTETWTAKTIGLSATLGLPVGDKEATLLSCAATTCATLKTTSGASEPKLRLPNLPF